ncbi:MAG: hypothetical protein CMQ21_02525 [Gammaproteobacteria bacterium]|mgnify:CR=1|jgi:hypothetical protein|nr:hypothetical protein [Gammaproteobacteria bacterium]|tara:strand:- start:630 stop:1004 length:375 start_codon:yes stop_codon:yes gene_type:complete
MQRGSRQIFRAYLAVVQIATPAFRPSSTASSAVRGVMQSPIEISSVSRSASGSNTIRRTGFFQSFVPDWLTSEENQYVAVPPEVAARLSDKARSVLGYSASRSLGWVRGRDSKNLLVEGTGAPV